MEQSKTKCIGITIETRPDYCLKPHLNEMLSYGCTRIEIGEGIADTIHLEPLATSVIYRRAPTQRLCRCAEYLRRCGTGHEPWPHSARCV
jgi:hypothetical protein